MTHRDNQFPQYVECNNDLKGSPPPGIGNLRWFWLSCLGTFVLLLPSTFARLIWLSTLNKPDEGYSRNELCALNFISAFLFAQRTFVSNLVRISFIFLINQIKHHKTKICIYWYNLVLKWSQHSHEGAFIFIFLLQLWLIQIECFLAH